MITLVSYGLGNVLAFLNVYKRLGVKVVIAENADDLKRASKVILPGVGAFDHAMELLDDSGMRATLEDLALGKRIPVLGVCVGMQILAGSSEEGRRPGLGWITGDVMRFRVTEQNALALPHMGWNDIRLASNDPLFAGLASEARFYFLHSYVMRCDREANVLAVADYGGGFTCAVKEGNIYGVQFHPEKSHHFGAQLLKNFAQL